MRLPWESGVGSRESGVGSWKYENRYIVVYIVVSLNSQQSKLAQRLISAQEM
ncbi:MAG: hypothetical protein F6K53_39385 [Moorea sp. SIO4A1]|uniref:hypothetical protein n=1 Tax=Moorena sp. SIO4A1 TaxID=2607835 RepID=UPI00144D8D1B|nr:hypothetical protein [Moorena sp. SIO4A1]NEQ63099.1 hypothetical protein [Moorena sp. SIO4A1]